MPPDCTLEGCAIVLHVLTHYCLSILLGFLSILLGFFGLTVDAVMRYQILLQDLGTRSPSCLEYWLLKAHNIVPPRNCPGRKELPQPRSCPGGRDDPQADLHLRVCFWRTQPMMVTCSSTHNIVMTFLYKSTRGLFLEMFWDVYPGYLVSVNLAQLLPQRSVPDLPPHILTNAYHPPFSTFSFKKNLQILVRVEKKFRFLVNLQFTKIPSKLMPCCWGLNFVKRGKKSKN